MQKRAPAGANGYTGGRTSTSQRTLHSRPHRTEEVYHRTHDARDRPPFIARQWCSTIPTGRGTRMDVAVLCALVLLIAWWSWIERARKRRDHEIHRWPGRLDGPR